MKKTVVVLVAASSAAAAGAGGAWWAGRSEVEMGRERDDGARSATRQASVPGDVVGNLPSSAPAPATLAEYGPCGPVLQWCSSAKTGQMDPAVDQACAAIRADVFGNLGRPSEKAIAACREVLPLLPKLDQEMGAAVPPGPTNHKSCAWVYKRCGEIDPNRSPVLAVAGGAEFCGVLQFVYATKKRTDATTERACAEIAHYFEPGATPELPAGMRATGGLFGRGLGQGPVYIETETIEETAEYYEDE